MGIGDRIKELRESKNISRSQLADSIGVTVGAISNYENGVSSPKEPVLFKLIEILECDANYLFQDFVKIKNLQNDITLAEHDLIKKYRVLDDEGKESVVRALNIESNRIHMIQRLQAYQQQLTSMIPKRLRTITYLRRMASAGTGDYIFDDLPTDTIDVPVDDVSSQADFVIGVNGDSMQPTFYDGDNVYVKKTNALSIGDIGIFIRGSDCFIKEYGADGLLSHNAAYKNIPAADDIRVIGKVLGKVPAT